MVTKNNQKKRKIGPRIFFISVLILMVLLSIPFAKNISRRHRLNLEIKNIENEIIANEKKNSDLQKLIKYLDSQQFAEEQARLNLGLKKDGESVAVVKDDTVQKSTENNNETSRLFSLPESKKVVKSSFYLKEWRKYFFKY